LLGPYCDTALQAAAEKGDLWGVKLFLKEGAEVNAPPSDIGGRTALQAATEMRHFEVAEFLLQRGAHADAPPAKSNGKTALQAAKEAGDIALLSFSRNILVQR
jgi:ankyrin repeat protein